MPQYVQCVSDSRIFNLFCKVSTYVPDYTASYRKILLKILPSVRLQSTISVQTRAFLYVKFVIRFGTDVDNSFDLPVKWNGRHVVSENTTDNSL